MPGPPPPQQALLEQAFVLHRQGRLVEARDLYRRIEPHNVDSFRLLGTVECQLGQSAVGLDWLQKSIDLVPGQYEVHLIMGDALRALGRFEDAIARYGEALRYERRYAEAYASRGDVLRQLGRFEDALEDYRKAGLVKPDLKGLVGMNHYAHMALADWRGYAERQARLAADTETTPSILQSLLDDPALHRRAAQSHMARKMPPRGLLPAIGPARLRSGPGERLRIGYFSSDLRNHPLTHLLAGLFEQHDRTRFELSVFSFAVGPQDDWGCRVEAAADRYFALAGQPAADVARMARDLEIDVAIDLTGLTEGCRADVFAERVAPVQACYLGYLGTMGADYYDYLIADSVIVSPEYEGFYTEKIARLPCFQINDDKQMPSARTFTRAGLGLGDGFVFASFNQVYKITPEVFDSWMRILARAPDSVLWVYCSRATARDNLKTEAKSHGIDPERLVFAEHLPPEDHLARLPLADLFLDTFPYNAGATASGALRTQVPILTRMGQSFAARMGASLLTSVGLPELITETPEAYEDLAVALAMDPARMAAIKAKLAANLPESILFDTPRATRALEALFEAMHDRAARGLPPESLNG